jgi:HD-GYP domain-containing protein (c-di-GMP phosphodiesterase class II)
MVRFSDIINLKDGPEKEKKTPEEKGDEEKLWLSDTQILKVKEEDVLEERPAASHVSFEVVTYYEKFLERAMDVRERVMDEQGISPSPILSDLHYVIEKDFTDELYEYAMSAREDYDEILIHMIDVTFTAMRIGKGMDYDTKKLLQLGLAAFLENVGMYRIPEGILKKRGKLETIELEVIRKHPGDGAEILAQMGKRYQWLAETALQVHERADGSGYPNGLRGEEISELAAIIGLADTYAAMIKTRPYREKYIQTDAVKYIIKEAKGLFPPRILKVFLNQISLFPVNTLVRLNNKSIGRVLSTDKNQPLRPTIELLFDAKGNKLREGEIIGLSENPLLYIVESIAENEVP